MQKRFNYEMRLRNLLLSLLFAILGSFAYGQGHSDLDKKELTMLATMEKSQQVAKKAYAGNKNANTKAKYVKLTLELAHSVEISPALASAPKYKKAYLLYKEVLKADPQNAKAKQMIAMYDGIYKSLGKPSPKG